MNDCLVFIILLYYFWHYINLLCTRITSVCFTEQLTTSEGLARKLRNVSNCFQAIIPPSSLTQLPVTLADKRPTMESYFVCTQTSYTRTCTRTQAGMHALRHHRGLVQWFLGLLGVVVLYGWIGLQA